MMCIRFVTLICLFTADVQASSHWMVTETGLIQPKENSPFQMENPFDLISFLNQDTRWENMFILYEDLIQRQKRLNKYFYQLQYSGDIPKHVSANEHCRKITNIEILDWYTSFVEDGKFKGIQDREFLIQEYEKGNTKVPDCKKISSLTFSMFAFEHLEGMAQRQRLNATPEFVLPELFGQIMTVDQFGHWVSDMLRKNNSSWLHYNLASIYWRVKGNVPNAIECSRRAVHYAPRKHKSIPLLCLGTILHRSRRTSDAVVVLEAAADHDPHFPISHFVLGLAYAVRGDFNASFTHLDLSTKLHKQFNLANKFRTAILCHIDMKVKIDDARKAVRRLCNELVDYSRTEMIWLRIQTAFLKTMKHEENYDYLNVNLNLKKLNLITGLKMYELKIEAEKYPLLKYFFCEPEYRQNWSKEKGVHSINTAYNLHRAVQNSMRTSGLPPRIITANMTANRPKMLSEIGPIPQLPDNMVLPKTYISRASPETVDDPVRGAPPPARLAAAAAAAAPLYPPDMRVDRSREAFDREARWPSDDECRDAAPHFPRHLDAVHPVFMPFENKGIGQGRLLTERLGVPALAEMELPWHPPLCGPAHRPAAPAPAPAAHDRPVRVRLVEEGVATEYLKRHLMKYVSDVDFGLLKRMQDAEIGHRIHTAIARKIAPEWVLYSVAGLYWRARRQRGHAGACLAAAARRAPAPLRDVPLAALASLFLDRGLVADAAAAAAEAYAVNSYEPATNFVLAQISMVNKKYEAMLLHLQQTVRVEPHFLGGAARRLLTAWACVLPRPGPAPAPAHDVPQEKQFCAEVEPGVAMVCERDGTSCHVANRNCNAEHTSASESALLRMLELQEQPDGDHTDTNSDTASDPKTDTASDTKTDTTADTETDKDTQHEPIDDVDSSVFDKFIQAMPPSRHDKQAHQKNYDHMLHTVHKYMKGCGHRGCLGLKAEDLNIKEEDCTYQYSQLDYWLNVISFRQVVIEFDSKVPMEILGERGAGGAAQEEPQCAVPGGARGQFLVARVLALPAAGWQLQPPAVRHLTDLFHYQPYHVLGAKIARYLHTKPESWVGLVTAMWWCGVGGRGACALRCAAAALARLALPAAHRPLRPLAALLHMQSRTKDAKDISYLAFYTSPKSKVEAFLVAVAHTYKSEYEQAVWMYRYALSLDEQFLPAKACLHVTMCLMLFKDPHKKLKEVPA